MPSASGSGLLALGALFLLLAAGCVGTKSPAFYPPPAAHSDLVRAVRRDDVAAARRLLPPDPAALSAPGGSRGYTLLHEAVAFHAGNTLALLIESGAPLDARDTLGWTPLHLAAQADDKAIARALLEAGADIRVSGEQGETPLHVAINHDHRAMASLLLESGAPINVTDRVGRTPLDIARIRGFRWLEDQLRPRGAQPVGILIATYDWMYGYTFPDSQRFDQLRRYQTLRDLTPAP